MSNALVVKPKDGCTNTFVKNKSAVPADVQADVPLNEKEVM